MNIDSEHPPAKALPCLLATCHEEGAKKTRSGKTSLKSPFFFLTEFSSHFVGRSKGPWNGWRARRKSRRIKGHGAWLGRPCLRYCTVSTAQCPGSHHPFCKLEAEVPIQVVWQTGHPCPRGYASGPSAGSAKMGGPPSQSLLSSDRQRGHRWQIQLVTESTRETMPGSLVLYITPQPGTGGRERP